MRIFAYSVREDEVKYFERFRDCEGVDLQFVSEYPSMENAHYLQGFDAVSIITNVVTKEMYDEWHRLGIRAIATRSVGYDHLDARYMRSLGMRGVHASYSPNAVANYTIMLMLMACRNVLHILDRSEKQDFSLKGKSGKELSLCTVGVIGTGQIGETVIRHLSGFGCRILACDAYPKESLRGLAEYVDLATIYRECDIITLHVPGQESNRHLIDCAALSAMKDDVILVNTARGLLVDSQALIDAIESGKVSFAALDTFEEEIGLYYRNLEGEALNNPVRDKLMSLPNVILSPHMAFITEQSTSDMVGTTVRGLLAFEHEGENPAEIRYDPA